MAKMRRRVSEGSAGALMAMEGASALINFRLGFRVSDYDRRYHYATVMVERRFTVQAIAALFPPPMEWTGVR
jgi:hypothetical protein